MTDGQHTEIVDVVVTAIELDHKAQQAVAQHIQPKYLSVEPLPPVKHAQTGENREVAGHLVELRRMHRDAMHHVIARELHRPRQRARFTVAAAFEEAAQPAKSVTERG